ncbi:MAG TPA: hypothetical protein VGE38_15635 [Nocardioides sp.]|uniref:SCO4848 family membrane protein n=1 Tax=Nocardioides sp. TaxID=35761 RepID=UPI002ED95D46
MRFERKHALLLVGVAVWNFVTWFMFAKNLSEAHSAGEDRPTGYWVAHSVLIVVNLVIGGVLGALGVKALRAAKRD